MDESVKDEMRIKGVSMEITSDRIEWNKKHVVPTPLSGIRGLYDDEDGSTYD
jgi:hypothetical protein